MNLKNKLEQLNQEFTILKEKILAKLTLKDTNLQTEKSNHQETIKKLETTLKENSSSEQLLDTLLKDFQEIVVSIDQA